MSELPHEHHGCRALGAEAAHPISAVLADVDGTLVTKDKVLTTARSRP